MDTIDILIARIAGRLEELGISERAASLEATQTPDAIRYIRSRRAMPAAPRLAAIARVLSATPEFLLGETDENDFIHLEDPDDWARTIKPEGFDRDAYAELRRRSQSKPTFSEFRSARPDMPFQDERLFQIPVCYSRSFADWELGEWHAPEINEAYHILIERNKIVMKLGTVPLEEAEAKVAYCIFLPTNTMSPALPMGEPILVSPIRPVSEQDLALIYTTADEENESRGEVAIPVQISRIHNDGYDVDQFQGSRFTIPADKVVKIDRIFTMPDFLR